MLFDKTHNLLLRINLKVVKKKKKFEITLCILFLIKKKVTGYQLSLLS